MDSFYSCTNYIDLDEFIAGEVVFRIRITSRTPRWQNFGSIVNNVSIIKRRPDPVDRFCLVFKFFYSKHKNERRFSLSLFSKA